MAPSKKLLGQSPMIRFAGKSLSLAIALILSGFGSDQVVVRGQIGFVDDSSDIPPSPLPPDSPVPTRTSYPFIPTQATPSPGVTIPSKSVSPHYQLRPLPQLSQSNSRSSPVPAAPLVPRAATPAPGSSPSKGGPFGAMNRMFQTPSQANNGHRPTDGQRTADPGRISGGHRSTVTPVNAVSTPGSPTTGTATQAGHYNETTDPGFSSPVPPPTSETPQHPLLFSRSRMAPIPGPGSVFPNDRMQPPTIMGRHLGLQPGETATERSLRLMSAIGELERQVESTGHRNEELNLSVKQRDDQLLLAIREIRAARKDVATAREELERLREQVRTLQEKVRDAERDNAALLQTMAPLLQKLLEPVETSPPPDEAVE